MGKYTKDNAIMGVPAHKDAQVLCESESVASGDTLAVKS